jgi:tRNA threonylcarbamoyladenosine biosynthesis protein TsaB
MLLLIVDTSGKQGCIALARGGLGEACEVIEASPLVGGTFSAQLVPQVADLLSKRGFSKGDIDAFVVVTGPGSFTGLRVGLAATKALAEVLAKPIAAVSLLEAMTIAAYLQGSVMTVFDAGRKEVYLGEYEIASAETRVIAERLLTREAWLELASNATIVTPDPDIAAAALAKGLRVVEVEGGPIDAIMRLGWKKILAGETVSPEALDANYGRRSDAEIFVRSSS